MSVCLDFGLSALQRERVNYNGDKKQCSILNCKYVGAIFLMVSEICAPTWISYVNGLHLMENKLVYLD